MLAPLACGCGDTMDDRPAKWSYISAVIVQPSCATANCHSALTSRSSVDLSGMLHGYDRLVGGSFVRPGEPECSSLMNLLTGEGTRRMPPTFPLPNADIALIARWIEAGAPYDGPGTPTFPAAVPATPTCAAADAGAGGAP
jgi:hypothetical protein